VARNTCLLCAVELAPLDDHRQAHPDTPDCNVRVTDLWGVAIIESKINGIEPPEQIDISTYPYVEDALIEIFGKAGIPRLGGVSTGRGWSSISTYQRCPLAWRYKYVEQRKPWILTESPALAIGTLVHVFLAAYYQQMLDSSYPLSPEHIYDAVRRIANPEFTGEAWRLYSAYRMFYTDDAFHPLAIEHDLKDPRTGDSCRYDLIAFFPESIAGRPAGTYVIEHKTVSAFSADNLEGWVCDGEVIGQIALWKKLGLDLRFGELQGVLVNLLGKQKDPQFHRTYVAPTSWQIQTHLDDLRRWEGLLQLSLATNNFPRARQGCLSRYGRCGFWDLCAGDGA